MCFLILFLKSVLSGSLFFGLGMGLSMVALCVGTVVRGRCFVSVILGLCVSLSGSCTLGLGIGIAGVVSWANVTRRVAGVVFSCLVGASSRELLLSKLSSCLSSSSCSSDFMFRIPFSAYDRSMIALEMMSAGDKVGCVMYFVLKKTVSDTLLLFVCLT